MKIITATLLTGLILSSLEAQAAQPIINLSIDGELVPGVYGQVQFGNSPPPPVLYQEARIILRDPRMENMEPLYLHVPPGHAKNWRKHCRKYDACNRPVYFVKSEEYEPGYSEGRRHGREHDSYGDEGDHHEDQGDHGGGHRGHHNNKHRD